MLIAFHVSLETIVWETIVLATKYILCRLVIFEVIFDSSIPKLEYCIFERERINIVRNFRIGTN